ncbi:MAG TPA: hypothetical protein VNA44_10370 [Burkholderiaceae bacterium]|nr:hypothetical protein [Burkholderiaceae bacterium]
MANLFAAPLVATLLVFASTKAEAGPYGDDLAKCLVNSTTATDKRALIKWMFATAALHPDLAPITAGSPRQYEAFNKAVGTLFERLLTKTCRRQAEQAVKFEGEATIESSFQILGQAAARELFAHPKVAARMADMAKHADSRKGIPVLGNTAAGSRAVAAPVDPNRVKP